MRLDWHAASGHIRGDRVHSRGATTAARMKPDLCIYHGNCLDGFGAAWAVRKRWDGVEFVPGIYGEQPPPVVDDAHVLIVDFSYEYSVLKKMALRAASITILDHHKT